MKKIISAVLVLTMMLALLSGCGDNSASENNVETSDLYEQVMARFDGELEEGAVIKVLENDTAVELGYVDQLINAFNGIPFVPQKFRNFHAIFEHRKIQANPL